MRASNWHEEMEELHDSTIHYTYTTKRNDSIY